MKKNNLFTKNNIQGKYLNKVSLKKFSKDFKKIFFDIEVNKECIVNSMHMKHF